MPALENALRQRNLLFRKNIPIIIKMIQEPLVQ